MRKLFILFFVGLAITVSSCRQDFVFEPSTGDLTFSKETVYLDTVFTNIGSSTYTLKVYNKSNKDIKIPTIRLAKGVGSKYRITVDGMTGYENRLFHDVELLAKDSMYIFIETTAGIGDANPTDFLYTDQIEFDSGANLQKVELVTLIQDAYFIFPNKTNGVVEQIPIDFNEDGSVKKTNGRNLNANHPDNGNEYLFKTDKPYVVYGYASVPDTKTLTIPKGARVYFHADSGIVVQQGGTLNIEGDISADPITLENEVIFEGDRLEPDFSDVPGQWGAIFLRQGSTSHITNLTLKNAAVGLLVEDNAGIMTINNTQIYNCSNYGILSYNGTIDGKKVVINNCGQFSLAAAYGGAYNFTNCTFNNNWSSSKQLAVYVSDNVKDGVPESYPLQASFTNCIIYGSNSNEIILDKKGPDFTTLFQNCLVKINVSSGSAIVTNPEGLYDAIRLEQNGNKINDNPHFQNIAKNKLLFEEDSPASGTGINAGIAFDILGKPRVSPYDIGAYNWIVFPPPPGKN